jgi:hypothetical protein
MTHLKEVQTVEAAGIPRTEYRYYPEPEDVELITLEFTVCQESYAYSHPQFTFRQLVATKEQWQDQQDHPDRELDLLSICALELVEPRDHQGELTRAPHWRYGLSCSTGTKELVWFDESELVDPSCELAENELDWF